jgi:PAS domain S-box-containing protein
MPKTTAGTMAQPPDQGQLQSEERFRTLIQQSTDAIQLLNEKGEIIYSSDSVRTVLGYVPEDFHGTLPLDYIHPEDLPMFMEKLKGLMADFGGKIQMEYRVINKTGKWVWIETIGVNHLKNPAIRALVGNFRDITARKEIEQALRESEAQLRFMAESMPVKIFRVNAAELIDYYNPQWIEYFGTSAEDINRLRFAHFIHPDDLKVNMAAWQSARKTGRPFEVEQRYRRSDGQYRWHLTRANPFRNDDGEIMMWIGSSTDIEDIKQSEKRQAKLEQQTALLTAQREQLMELNRAKDEFISLASHQLRTPATGVKQFLGMVLDGFVDTPVPPDILHFIEVAYESNERQLKIVNDLLKVAYVDAGKVKIHKDAVDLQALVGGVLKELDGAIKERQQKVVVRNRVGTAELTADKSMLRMILENLIDNASKYSAEGKTITITMRSTKNDCILDFADQGVGIGDGDRDKLFKKFSRIDNPLSVLVGGTGLGLYWVQQIVALHGGSISLKSAVGKGTTFSVRLPLA